MTLFLGLAICTFAERDRIAVDRVVRFSPLVIIKAET
jgi:hypothetical protein